MKALIINSCCSGNNSVNNSAEYSLPITLIIYKRIFTSKVASKDSAISIVGVVEKRSLICLEDFKHFVIDSLGISVSDSLGATAEDIAKVVKFLALDTEYVTGQAIEVAGGLML